MSSRKHDARVAGVLYLLLAVIAPFSMMYIPSVFIVRGDAAATAGNIASSELLYRIGVASDLASHVIFVCVVLALYQLLREVNQRHAALMAVLALVSVPMAFINTLNQSAPLILLSGADFLSAFDKHQLDALAYAFLRLQSQGIIAVSAYWGLWLLPFGLLVYRSGFLPRILGVFLWIAGFAYLVGCLTSLLFPAYGRIISPYLLVLEAGELPIILWLVFKGARDQPPEGQASRPGNRVAVNA